MNQFHFFFLWIIIILLQFWFFVDIAKIVTFFFLLFSVFILCRTTYELDIVQWNRFITVSPFIFPLAHHLMRNRGKKLILICIQHLYIIFYWLFFVFNKNWNEHNLSISIWGLIQTIERFQNIFTIIFYKLFQNVNRAKSLHRYIVCHVWNAQHNNSDWFKDI